MINSSVIASEQRERGNPLKSWIALSVSPPRNDVNLFKFFIILILLAAPAFAFQYEAPLPDAAQEKTAHEIFAVVRCLVCDGESLASSAADYSVSMRALIREQIAAGQSKEQLLEYLTYRYGNGVLQEPPTQGGGLVLWLMPILLLAIGALLMRRRAK